MNQTFEPVLSRRFGREGSHRLANYVADGGYRAFKKALSMSPDEIVGLVKASGLRGRGGAGFPCGAKWSFLPAVRKGPTYLCVNADESEPGTFNNRVLMEEDP